MLGACGMPYVESKHVYARSARSNRKLSQSSPRPTRLTISNTHTAILSEPLSLTLTLRRSYIWTVTYAGRIGWAHALDLHVHVMTVTVCGDTVHLRVLYVCVCLAGAGLAGPARSRAATWQPP